MLLPPTKRSAMLLSERKCRWLMGPVLGTRMLEEEGDDADPGDVGVTICTVLWDECRNPVPAGDSVALAPPWSLGEGIEEDTAAPAGCPDVGTTA